MLLLWLFFLGYFMLRSLGTGPIFDRLKHLTAHFFTLFALPKGKNFQSDENSSGVVWR